MRLASSLPALAALNRQLGSVLQELEQQRAAAPPDSQLDVQPGVGAAFRNARGSDGGVRSGGDGMGAGASGASGAGGSGGAAAVDAGGDDGTGSERPPVSVGDGLPILPAPGTEAGNAPPISDALISAIQRARLHPQSEPVRRLPAPALAWALRGPAIALCLCYLKPRFQSALVCATNLARTPKHTTPPALPSQNAFTPIHDHN